MKFVLFFTFLASVFASISANAELSFSAHVSSYLTETEREGQEDWYYTLLSTYKTKPVLLGYESHLFLGAELTLNDLKSSQLFIPEAYIENQNKNRWWLGRKIVGSFQYEKIWEQSFINPFYRKDFLAPIKQGIFGLHYKYRFNKNLYISALLSPIHLPDQGPKVNEDNGTIYSSNRWFGGQISEIKVGSGVTSIVKYDLKTPKFDDLILNPGAILELGLNINKKVRVRSLYAYKPMNQFHLAADVTLDSSLSGNFNTLTEVIVTVPYHKLAILEASYRSPKYNLWAGFISEKPERPEIEAQFFEANLEDRNQYHIGVDFKFLEPIIISASYLKAKVKPLSDEPQVASINNAELNINRHFYNEAFILTANYNFTESYSADMKYIYSFLEKGGLGSVKLNKKFNKKLNSYLKFTIVGVDKEVDNGFFSPLRDNDFLEIGVRYVL